MRIDRDQVARELVELLDEADRREAALAEHSKDEREAIKALRAQAAERRDIIAGRRGSQLSIGHVVHEEARAVAARKRKRELAPCVCGLPGEVMVAAEPGGDPVVSRCRGCAAELEAERANDVERQKAKDVGNDVYENRDSEGVLVVRCVDCDGSAGSPPAGCGNARAHRKPEAPTLTGVLDGPAEPAPRPKRKRGAGRTVHTVRCPACGMLHRTGDGLDPKCWEAMDEAQRAQMEGKP